MFPPSRVTALVVFVAVLLVACGQKGPLFMPEDELPKAAKAQQKPKAKPKQSPKPQAAPTPTPEPEEPSPDMDETQDGYAPMADPNDF
jgi:predicted small lipoprotein YifL